MTTLDDVEDFRERICKCETGLVVVGGCNDRLVVCGAKKRTDGITQGMVDRCVADEIYDFVSCMLNPNHTSMDQMASNANAASTPARTSSGSKSPAPYKASPLAQVPLPVKKKRRYVRRSESEKAAAAEAI